jgi:hypothetical protein
MEIENMYDIVSKHIFKRRLGLDQLLTGKLSLTLVNSTHMSEVLGELKARVLQGGYVLPLDQVGFTYQLPASFMIDPEGELTIFLHVPVLTPNNILTLYELVAMPVAIENSVHAIKFIPEIEFLAVNAAWDGLIPLDTEDLAGCYKMGKLHLCDNTNYLLKDFEFYCISGLFLQLNDVITQKCPTGLVPNKVIVTQLERSDFFIFHPINLLLRSTARLIRRR